MMCEKTNIFIENFEIRKFSLFGNSSKLMKYIRYPFPDKIFDKMFWKVQKRMKINFKNIFLQIPLKTFKLDAIVLN